MRVTKNHKCLRVALTISLTLLLLFGTSCATLFNPAIQNIPVATHPEGCEVWVDGELVGEAPLTLELDTRKNHDITVRRGDNIRTWTLQHRISSNGGLALAGDVVVLVPAVVFAVMAFQAAAGPTPTSPYSYGLYNDISWPGRLNLDFSGVYGGIAVGCLVVGLAPLVVDAATNQFYELEPGEITADFE